MMLVSDAPMLNINSSLLDWERCLVVGHLTNPLCCTSVCMDQLLTLQLHQTCFASSLLSPETPDDIPGLLNPALSFVAVPRSSVRLFGPF